MLRVDGGGTQTFREWQPDLLVTDIGIRLRMVRSDQEIKKTEDETSREIPAVAITAYATDDDRARVLSAGFQMHVAKPIEPEALVRSLADAGRPQDLSWPVVLNGKRRNADENCAESMDC